MPPTNLHFQNSSKTIPKEAHPNFSIESTSRKQNSSHVEQLGSLREINLFVFLRTIANHRIQVWECRSHLGIHMSKQVIVPLRGPDFPIKPMSSSIIVPLGTNAPNLGASLMMMRPNIVVTSYLGKPLGAFACSRHPLSQLGC
jgi:hypothetical protein